MTTVYRERHRIRRPAALVERDLRGEFGSGESVGEGTTEWDYDRAGGLYRYRVRLDARAGDVTVSVGVPGPFRALSVVALGAALLVTILGGSGPPLGGLLWASSLLALVPVAHRLPGIPGKGPAVCDRAETVERTLAPVAAVPYLAVVVVLVAGGRPGDPVRATAVAALAAVGLAIYYAAGGTRRDPAERAGVRDADGGVPSLGIALSALLPAVVTLVNVLVVASVLDGSPGPAEAGLALVVVLALDAAFFAHCRLTLEQLVSVRIVTPRSRTARVGGVLAQAGANAAVLWVTVATLGPPGAMPASGSLPAVATGGRLDPLLVTLLAAAVLPVGVVVLGWFLHLATTLTTGIRVLARSERVGSPSRVTGVEVRVAALGVPVARPVAVPGRRFVLVDRSLYESLESDELAAVVAHEAHHLRARDPATNLLVALGSVAVGGRNAALSFTDYAAVERRADDHAAEVAGAESLVAALRRMETLRLEAGAVGSSLPPERTRLELARDTLLAPYRLLFGSVLLDAAHADVDDRVRRVLGGDTG